MADEEVKNEAEQESAEATSTEPVAEVGDTTGTDAVAESEKVSE